MRRASAAPTVTQRKASEPAAAEAEKTLGWQQQKSLMARERILAAAVECLADVGYADLTLSLIAERAGLSRGAMQHHFASKNQVIRETIVYIFEEQLKLQKVSARKPGEPIDYALHRRRVETLWKYMKAPFFTAYIQIAVSSRNDPVLSSMVKRAYRDFTIQGRQDALENFPEWQSDRPRFEFVAHLVSTMLEGMATRQMFGQSTEAEDKPIRDQLARIIGDLFQNGLQA